MSTEDLITRVDLIRHGEPVGGRRYRGQLDDPLSEKGWQQMRDAVSDHCPWDTIISSPLSRCAEFATEISERYQRILKLEPNFKEIGFGDWEGKTAVEIQTETPGALEAFWRDPITERPPGAEPLVEFQQRIESAWNNLLAEHKGQNILVVCHAGVIRMSMQYILGMPLENVFRINVANASITRMQIDHASAKNYPQLIFHHGQL